MSRDIQVKVQLSAVEYVAFRHIADEAGQSQSGMARSLIKACIQTYAESSARSPAVATDEQGQE